MKEYNIDLHEGKHKVKITLQYGKYKGHIIYVIGGGGGYGLGIIDTIDFESETFEGCENDCKLTYHDDCDYFTVELVSDDGDVLSIEEDSIGMNDMIVAIEIIDYSAQ